MKAQAVANYFLDHAEIDSIPITPLKLIKLVYIAYGWHIALIEKKLFDEPILAWKHGPVIESLYHEFKNFGNSPIFRRSYDFDLDSGDFYIPIIEKKEEQTLFILSKVWLSYKEFTASQLRNITYEEGSPWSKVYKPEKRTTRLNDKDISTYYKERIRAYISNTRAIQNARAVENARS